MGKAILAMVLLVAWVGSATASPVYIQSPASTFYQQTENSPCVVGNASCKSPALWDYALISDFATGAPGTTEYTDALSPWYSFAQLASILGISGDSGAFVVGVDVNWAGDAPETLTKFEIYQQGVTGPIYSLSDPFTFVYTNNGNGYSDALIYSNALFTAGFPIFEGNSYQFKVSYTGRDGQEQFFLINTSAPPPTVPDGGSSLLLMGLGLAGLRMWKKR